MSKTIIINIYSRILMGNKPSKGPAEKSHSALAAPLEVPDLVGGPGSRQSAAATHSGRQSQRSKSGAGTPEQQPGRFAYDEAEAPRRSGGLMKTLLCQSRPPDAPPDRKSVK